MEPDVRCLLLHTTIDTASSIENFCGQEKAQIDRGRLGGPRPDFDVLDRLKIAVTQTADGFAIQEAIPVAPQQLTQGRRITAIGLAAFAFLRLDENHLVATVVPQHPNQPVIEAAHFDDGNDDSSR